MHRCKTLQIVAGNEYEQAFRRSEESATELGDDSDCEGG